MTTQTELALERTRSARVRTRLAWIRTAMGAVGLAAVLVHLYL